MAMSTETGSLILKADATQVESASTSLDNLSASADRADKAVE